MGAPVVHVSGGMLYFHCPGCEYAHGIAVDGSRGWSCDGVYDAPTISPSILVRYQHWVPPASLENPNPGVQVQRTDICHSFVRAGQIQFLPDCTHRLAGQTVPLEPWDAP